MSQFSLLDSRIQRWVWTQGWEVLRDIQEQAIPAILSADRDIIIAAATATGKTEAAFFPILSYLLAQKTLGCVFYISPLKALINDQWQRLNQLCEQLEIPVIAWHGDSKASAKQQFLKKPQGIVLITPESLEALFVNRGSAVSHLAKNLTYLVIDELHAFMGSERGTQLQSLLHRMELAAGRHVPRIALSATLGDLRLAAIYLRQTDSHNVCIIESKAAQQELKILVKGYLDGTSHQVTDLAEESPLPKITVSDCELAISAHLYQVLRHSNNLVFPNSRALVESYANHLSDYCEKNHVPNVFWPHHGSLAKDIRAQTEQALKDGSRPATAICTTTLELGIDIGSIKSIAQIGSPPSVSSLRQRLGRSGRREGEAAILRAYCIEPVLTAHSNISDRIREELVQTVAMIQLLLVGWYEPPAKNTLHASTLVQQILSIVAQKGGVLVATLWQTLVTGAFFYLQRDDFLLLLRYLGERDILVQDSSGLLLHGSLGEKLVNHYDFYCAFATNDEYRVECNAKVLGTLPLNRPLLPQQGLIFAGRSWRVLSVDEQSRRILVLPSKGGVPPSFDSAGIHVHHQVRQQMRQVLASQEPIVFLDTVAQNLMQEARQQYHQLHLAQQYIVVTENGLLMFTWRGDVVNNTIVLLLAAQGVDATAQGIAINIQETHLNTLKKAITRVGSQKQFDLNVLLADAKNLQQEKWDWLLPKSLLFKSYAAAYLDIQGALEVLAEIKNSFTQDEHNNTEG